MAKLNAAVVTVSDTRDMRDDESGDRLEQALKDVGAEIVERLVVTDDLAGIVETLTGLTKRDGINVVFTTGGTGLAARDNTPEATLEVIETEIPGMSEAMRRETAKFTQMAMLSRGVSGIKRDTLIINLPGSPKGVIECFDVIKDILPHAVGLIQGETDH